MKVVRRTNTHALQRLLDATAGRSPSFDGDPDSTDPPGYRAEEHRRRLGAGDDVFTVAAAAIKAWHVQRGSGLVAHTAAAEVREGADVVVGLPVGPLLILAPCRVDRVYDSALKSGFRYVTMPGHPERGHEEFVVERDAEGTVFFLVRPVSRPGSALTWLGAPVARAVQHVATRRYLDTMSELNR